MARHLFIAQQTLSTWMDQDKIDFDGDIMTIKADGRRFKLVEAVRFVRVEGDEADARCLLGKVKTNAQLEQLGAERYRDSVLVEDVAYQAQEGFIGEVFLDRLEAEAPPACQPAAQPAAEGPAEQAAAKESAERAAAEGSAERAAAEGLAEQAAAKESAERAAAEGSAERAAAEGPAEQAARSSEEAAAGWLAGQRGAAGSGEQAGTAGSSEGAEQGAAARCGPAADERPLAVARTQPALDSVEQQRPAPQRPSDSAPKKQQPAEGNDELSDEELLTRFLLENL
jgi:hypothetical protein